MNEYDDEIQFLTSNKDFIIFKCYNREAKYNVFASYYFINKNNKECEKIVNLHLPYDPNHYYSLKNHVLIWNKDLTKSAVTMTYRLNPTDVNYVSCIYMIDWNTMTKTLLNDSKYQLAARQNDQIIQDKKEEERRADNAKYEENERLRAIARAIGWKCPACNGSGKGISTMEVSGTSSSTTITNNVNFNWSQTVGGSSTYSSTQHTCTVCGGSGVVHD